MSYRIVGKYIKDLEFSIPNSKAFYLLTENIANYKINIDIKSNRIKENIFEILISLNLTQPEDNSDKIITKIVFASIIELSDSQIDKIALEKIILIDVPDKIYPELREVFVKLFEYSGFKDIKINEKIDFNKLYKIRKAQ